MILLGVKVLGHALHNGLTIKKVMDAAFGVVRGKCNRIISRHIISCRFRIQHRISLERSPKFWLEHFREKLVNGLMH
jgi:hypothetical protein